MASSQTYNSHHIFYQTSKSVSQPQSEITPPARVLQNPVEFHGMQVFLPHTVQFPYETTEAAREMALMGAELLLYPTAIGSEPILEVDSMPHWRRCMQGHAATNLMPVIAANRIGREEVESCDENGGQKSALEFYGSSFLTDETGELLVSASRDKEEILSQTYELDELREKRLEWGLFRDRRPECYGIIAGM